MKKRSEGMDGGGSMMLICSPGDISLVGCAFLSALSVDSFY